MTLVGELPSEVLYGEFPPEDCHKCLRVNKFKKVPEDQVEDLEAEGLTCWVPLNIPIDFAEQSKVIAIGRTGQGKARDANGNPTFTTLPGIWIFCTDLLGLIFPLVLIQLV